MATCFECDGPAEHRHHVVPQLKGGTRTVWLCRPHHAQAHGADGLAPQGWLPSIPAPIVALAAEMYQDGWTLWELARFLNAAGVRDKRFGPNSFLRAFDKLGVDRRRKGPRKDA